MNKVSFEGIGEIVGTFGCAAEVQAGQVVAISGDGAVGPCAAEGRFCGVALSVEDGYGAVQVRGFVSMPVSGGAVGTGYVKLAADGDGGVKKAAAGAEYLVVREEAGSAVVLL